MSELQISFWGNWVFTQHDYPHLCTCKINCVFLFFYPTFFVVTNNVLLLFLSLTTGTIARDHYARKCEFLKKKTNKKTRNKTKNNKNLSAVSAMFFILNVAIGNLPAYIYSLTSFAFQEHQTSGFYHTSETNIIPLLIFIARIHNC